MEQASSDKHRASMIKPGRTSLPLWVKILYIVLGSVCAGLVLAGAVRSQSGVGQVYLIAGIMGMVLMGAAVPIVWMMHRLASQQSFGPVATSSSPSTTIERLLAEIYENSMLSDNAKRVLFRDRELNLLRQAIDDDIANGDYNAGLTLCDEMANLFGHREEAEAFRTRIHQAGHASYEAKVHQALEQFEQVLRLRDWAGAYREAARLRRLYPNHHFLDGIDQRILAARDEHKHELEAQFLDAAQRDDVPAAMLLLKELDRYLTRDEATRLSQVAQDVVVKHRDNLSTQFKLAVNDHRWAEAAQVGDLIINEYPNTKMADEVRTMIDVLRVRATQAAVMSEA